MANNIDEKNITSIPSSDSLKKEPTEMSPAETPDVSKKMQRKIDRDKARGAREQRRDARAEEFVRGEAQKYGVDIDELSSKPITDDSKERITSSIKQLASKDVAQDIDAFSKAYGAAPEIERPALDKEAMKEQARKARRMRWADALAAFGAGYQGRESAPVRERLEGELGQKFSQYRDITERSKKTRDVWEDKYRNDLLAFVSSKTKDDTLSPAEKEKFKLLRDELQAKVKGGYFKKYPPRGTAEKEKPIYTEQIDGGAWRMSTGKQPYSDILYNITDDPDALMPTIEGKQLTPAQREDYAKQLVSQMYEFKTNEKGERIAVPIPGKENYLNQIKATANKISNLEDEVFRLEEERDKKTAESSWWEVTKPSDESVNEEYNTKIEAIKSQINELKASPEAAIGEQVEVSTDEDPFANWK